jgi:hypothetical protein
MKRTKLLICSLAISIGISNQSFAFDQPGDAWISFGVLYCMENSSVICFTDWNDNNKTFKSGGTYDIYLGMGSWESGVVIMNDSYDGKPKEEIREISGGRPTFTIETLD